MDMNMHGAFVPPNNLDAEQSVLGCMLMDEQAASVSIGRLSDDDFYSFANKEIFKCMKELNLSGKPLDVITVTDSLEDKGSLEGVGGVTYITSLSRYVPSSAHINHYIDIVFEKSILRRMIKACSDITRMCFEPERNSTDILNAAEHAIFELSTKEHQKDLRPLKEALLESYEKINFAFHNKGKGPTGIPTGFAELDKITSGLNNSDLIIVAGRPGMGKTTFAINIAQQASVNHQKSVAIFSLEMSREQLATRMLVSEAVVDMQSVKSGQLSKNDLASIMTALKDLSIAPIFVDDTAGITPQELRSKCRRLKIEQSLDLIVIDYLQLMESGRKTDNRQQEISEITRFLKNTARELNVPIILLSQLSRAVDNRTDHRPVLSDLRESGAIEQDADIVLFLYREYVYSREEESKDTAEIIIAKHRNGPTGKIDAIFEGQYTRFKGISDREDPYPQSNREKAPF